MLHPLALRNRRDCLKDDRQRVDNWLRTVPAQFTACIRREHNKLLFSEEFRHDGDARRAANLHVQDRRDHFKEIGGRLNLAASDDELCTAAKQAVQHVESIQRLHRSADFESLLDRLADYLRERDVFFYDDEAAPEGCTRLPQPEKRGVTHETLFKRLVDEGFWRKVLRRAVARKVEAEAIRCGFVNQRAGLYVSDDTLLRVRAQRCRNRALLESLVAFNELGDEFTLAELSDLSVSNPNNRRAELMTRIAGFETIARSLEHAALFLTVTCPSRFHAFRKLGKGKVVANTKYCGSTPRQAQQYLSGLYACIRAELHRRNISPYGFRIAEPHHDACPHWHLLLFVPQDQAADMIAVFRDYSTREDRDELAGGDEPRFKCVEIDWSLGTAAGYVAKYVCKNIDGRKSDGESIGINFDGVDTATAAERVLAWASVWGIRQFQQVGIAPVTIWRELRRISNNEGIEIGSDIISRAAEAADAGEWAEFVKVLGGTGLKLADLPIRLGRETGRTNRYGEDVGVRILGVVDADDGVFVKSRIHKWTVDFAPDRERSEPWTRVNNYTAAQRGGTTRVPPPVAMRRGGDKSRPSTVAVHEQRAGGVT
ncbi:hypothetical protein HNQ59_001076 [Chitinivorax tropicus]|uniref:Replication gene A protein-like domain-containing protein n=1 Tax=Chitinivorax tropicus TaxID=714531 RepID=A0A840MMS3_9PROT|nr:replication endonuclease [Chitinivorax tropicus]MBB5017806.1 hypothetical protein [Chitinivorax tropicus]